MMLQELYGNEGILFPNAIYVPKREEIAISKDWLIFPEAISGEGKVWTIDGRLEPIQKQENEMWICMYQDQKFEEPLQYKTKNAYNWHVVEVSCENELDYVDKANIKHLILSNNIKTIKDEEFLECMLLKTIQISDSVTYIGNRAFNFCHALHNIIIPDSVTNIGGGVFYNCVTLKSITLPNTLKELKAHLVLCDDGSVCEVRGFFYGCNALEHIKLPDNLITLEDCTFSDCYSLKDIVLPDTLETIGQYAFYYCTSLQSITIPDSVTSIHPSAFASCTALKNVRLSENLQIISDSLFQTCNDLTSIVIPDKVTEIGHYAFMETGLQKLTLGKNVNFIGEYGFSTPLQTITSYAVTPPQIQWNTFDNVDRGLTLIVPNPELYRNADYWYEFYNIYTINPYEVNIMSANEDWGTVTVELNSLEEVHINAIAKDGFKFKHWSDGITDSWRSISPTEDINLVAEFEVCMPSISLYEIVKSDTDICIYFGLNNNGYIGEATAGYVYDVVPNSENNKTNIPIEWGSYQNYTITNLQPETTYYIRMFVETQYGTIWIEEMEIETAKYTPKFSVGDNTYVTFSPGNLQYTQSTNTWSFAENQYDYIGTDNVTGGSVSSDPTSGDEKYGTALADKIDLFGWSTAATNFGVSTSTSYTDYSGSFVDWGTNKIGDDAPNTWRTLTYDEWNYLCWERPNNSNLCGVAQVNGVNGLVFLPDNWTCPAGITFKSGFHSSWGVDYYAAYQTFTAEQWAKLEAAGAVFLPAAGYRTSSLVRAVQYYGSYWSATERDNYDAYRLSFYSDEAGTGFTYRYDGLSVRLVKNID